MGGMVVYIPVTRKKKTNPNFFFFKVYKTLFVSCSLSLSPSEVVTHEVGILGEVDRLQR